MAVIGSRCIIIIITRFGAGAQQGSSPIVLRSDGAGDPMTVRDLLHCIVAGRRRGWPGGTLLTRGGIELDGDSDATSCSPRG
jgi:hypothetical protein